MNESPKSPLSVLKRQPFSSALVLSIGALAGLMWVLIPDEGGVVNVWKGLLFGEIGAAFTASSWLVLSARFARRHNIDLNRVRRADALTYLPIVLSLFVTLNLVFWAGKLDDLVFTTVFLMFIGAKIIEIIWLYYLHKYRKLRTAIPAALAVALFAGLISLAWTVFTGGSDYWRDREVVKLPGDSAPAFTGQGAKRVHVNAMGRWRSATRMTSPGVYRAVINIDEPARLSLGFLASDHHPRAARVSIKVNETQLIEERVETADDWNEKSWPIGTGEAELRISPMSGEVFVSDPSITNRPGRPNILIVVIDTLRADHLGCYGYPRDTAPRICALAEKGLLFEKHFSPTTWSTSAVASLFSGLYPSQHGCVDFAGLFLPLEITTFAEMLKKSGYRTAGVSGNPLLSVKSGFAQGFDSFNEKCLEKIYYRGGECMTDQGIAESSDGGPELLFLQYFDPHAPYDAPPPILGMYRGWPESRPDPGTALKFITNRYDEEIRYEDREVARLLDYLKSTGWLDNAVIIITADHGEELGEHGRVSHGYTVYEGATHVPLVIVGPGGIKGRRISGLTSSIDIYATILAAAGIALPAGTQGNNLLADPTPTRPFVFADVLEQTALRTLKWKILGDTGRRKEYLFDIESDPDEQNDLSALNPEMRMQLHRQMQEVIAEMGKIKSATPHARALEVQMHRRLRALGYIQ